MVSERTQRRRISRSMIRRGVAPRPSSSNSPMYQEITVPGNYRWAGVNYSEVLRRSPVSFDQMQQMIDMDGHARAIYNSFRRPILRNTKKAYIKPHSVTAGEKEAEFIHQNLLAPRHEGGMTVPLTRVVAYMCTAFYSGFRTFEKVLDPPGTFDDDFTRLRKLRHHDPRTVQFTVDKQGGFNGIHQKTSWRGQTIDRDLSREKVAYFAIDEEEQAFYGKPIFLPAYYHFDKKHKIYYMLHLALAVGALPPRIAKAHAGVSQDAREKFLTALSNLGTNSALMIPEGFELEENRTLVTSAGGLPYIEAINHHDVQMSKAVLMQFLDIGTSTGGGSFSLNKNHQDFAIMTLEGIMEDMADMFNNYVIPELIDWNFGTKLYPKLVFPPFTNDTRDMMFELFGKIMTARSTNASPEFITELEREVAKELDIDIESSAFDRNLGRMTAMKELEEAVERANIEIGEKVQNMTPAELLRDEQFMEFAAAYSSKVRDIQLAARATGDLDI